MSNNSLKKYKMKFSVIILIAAVALSVGLVGAKYVYETYGDVLFRAKEFYFESNLLRSEDTEYILNPTTKEISFTLVNATDELRKSEDDISYDIYVYENNVNVTEKIFDSANSDTGLELTQDNNKYSVKGTLLQNDDSITTHTVSLKNMERGKTYSVVVKGKAGYVKTLEAKFTVSDSDKNLWKHLTVKDEYVLLTVWSENLKGDISVKFPEGLIPDGTDVELSDVYNYEDGKYKESEFVDETNFTYVYSSHTYRFFIDNVASSQLSVNSFIVKNIVSTSPEVSILGGSGTPK